MRLRGEVVLRQGEAVLRECGGIRLVRAHRLVFVPPEVSVLRPDSWDGERGVSVRLRGDASEECLDCSYVNSFQNKVLGMYQSLIIFASEMPERSFSSLVWQVKRRH